VPDVRIRPATVGDAEALTDLHLDVWEEAYGHLISDEILLDRRRGRSDRIARWRQNIPNPEALTLLAWEDNRSRLLGFVSKGRRRDELEPDLPEVEIWALYVRADAYGRGVGYAMLTEAIGSADAYLWVLDGNARAIEFYERQGFGFDGTAKTDPVGVERRMVRRRAVNA
jgi:GNAT superfamily N-acetyltransferase